MSTNSRIEDRIELKAVVLADTFDDSFQPLSLNRPRCLLPLCNVPMIEYTLEALALSGVSEVILVCRSHADKLKEYIRNSKWRKDHSAINKITTVVARAATSVGDALRQLDEQNVSLSDFILCTSIIVSNMDLRTLVSAHLARRLKDKSVIMTMLLREATAVHRLRDKADESVYIIDPSSNKLLAATSFPSAPGQKYMEINTEDLASNAEIEIRGDLIDTNVYVCNMEVLALFTENFDYHMMRRDFVNKILSSDIYGMHIYAHILSGSSAGCTSHSGDNATAMTETGTINTGALPVDEESIASLVSMGGYAAGVLDTCSYDSISRDMVGRWTYPLCPDSNPANGISYTYNRGAIYKAPSVSLGRESRAERHVILGPNSRVADYARIVDSVLGRDCSVGEHSVVSGSHLFNSVTVGQNSVIEKSILGERVTILDDVVIERGCLIGDDVTIGPNVRITAFSRIASQPFVDNEDGDESDDDDDGMFENSDSDSDGEIDAAEASTARSGNVLHSKADSNDDEEDTSDSCGSASGAQILGGLGAGYVWDGCPSTTPGNSSSSNSRLGIRQLRTIGSSFHDIDLVKTALIEEGEATSADEADHYLDQQGNPEEDFEHELRMTVNRFFEENLKFEAVSIEVGGLRMAYDGDQDDMRRIIVEEVMSTIEKDDLVKSAKAVLEKGADLIKWSINGNMDHLDALDTIERYCATDSDIEDNVRSRLFTIAIRQLYEFDIVDDMAIVAWHRRSQAKSEEEVNHKFLELIQPLVDMLIESDDEEESE